MDNREFFDTSGLAWAEPPDEIDASREPVDAYLAIDVLVREAFCGVPHWSHWRPTVQVAEGARD